MFSFSEAQTVGVVVSISVSIEVLVTRIVVVATASLALVACGGSDDGAAPQATTASDATTAPEAVTTQSDEAETPDEVIAALRSAGLPIGAVRSYTETNDPNKLMGRPGQYGADPWVQRNLRWPRRSTAE